MTTKTTISKDTENSLEELYYQIFNNHPIGRMDSLWEKTGDNYKQFSLYDESGYETCLSSSIVVK